MIDIFYPKDVQKVLNRKHVVFLGDSNVRAMYKDLLFLSQKVRFLTNSELKSKMEKSFWGDHLINHGEKTNGRNFREEREAKSQGIMFSFCFLTRVYNEYVEQKLKEFTSISHEPDVFVIHSCLWDINRWGPNGVKEYKVNLEKLLQLLQKILSPKCLVIWLTCPPIASKIKGGFLVKQLEFLKFTSRFHVMEANQFAHKMVVSHGFDVLDVHYHFKMQLLRRVEDGIHWQAPAVRYLTNLLLTHICLAWGTPLPHRYECAALLKSLDAAANEIVIESKKQKTDKEIDSVPVKKLASAVKGGERKVVIENKENCNTPKISKKKKKNTNFQKRIAKSHHAFMSHMQHADRRKRIRPWQSEIPVHSPSFNPQWMPEMSIPSSFNFQLQSKEPLLSSPFNPQLQSEMPIFSSPFNPQLQSEMPIVSSPFSPRLQSQAPLLSSPFSPQLQSQAPLLSSPFHPQMSPLITVPPDNNFYEDCSPYEQYANIQHGYSVSTVVSQTRTDFNPFMQNFVQHASRPSF